jgi:3-phosphoglycerate kinase
MAVYPLVQFKNLEKTKRILLRFDFSYYELYQAKFLEFIEALLEADKQAVILASGPVEMVEKAITDCKKKSHQTYCQFACDEEVRFEDTVKMIMSEPEANLCFLTGLDDYGPEKYLHQSFAQQLALLGDLYIIDSLHLHGQLTSSVALLPLLLPTYYGPSTSDTWQGLVDLKKNLFSKRSALLLGGAVDFSKFEALTSLLPKLDYLMLGTVWTAYFWNKKTRVMNSKETENFAKVLKKFAAKVIYPLDFMAATYDQKTGRYDLRLAKSNEIQAKDLLVDLGPETIRYYALLMKESDNIIYDNLLSPNTNEPGHADMILARALANRARGKALGLSLGRPLLDLLLKENLNEFMDLIVPDATAVYKFFLNK